RISNFPGRWLKLLTSIMSAWMEQVNPQGLKGDEIILEARIVAVADVVEAMTNHRPYRSGLGIKKALAEIERGCGSIYDTDVANACLSLFREHGFSMAETR
ncbi:MAG: HD-GYP domain-containing protein, partial [Mariprofundus sp.]